jgi:hypothetical protein
MHAMYRHPPQTGATRQSHGFLIAADKERAKFDPCHGTIHTSRACRRPGIHAVEPGQLSYQFHQCIVCPTHGQCVAIRLQPVSAHRRASTSHETNRPCHPSPATGHQGPTERYRIMSSMHGIRQSVMRARVQDIANKQEVSRSQLRRYRLTQRIEHVVRACMNLE